MSRLFSRLARQAMGQPRNPVRPIVAQPFERQAGEVKESPTAMPPGMGVHDQSIPIGQPRVDAASTSTQESTPDAIVDRSEHGVNAETAFTPDSSNSSDLEMGDAQVLPAKRDANAPIRHEHGKHNSAGKASQADDVVTSSVPPAFNNDMQENSASLADEEAVGHSADGYAKALSATGSESADPFQEFSSDLPPALLAEPKTKQPVPGSHTGSTDSLAERAPVQLLPDRASRAARNSAAANSSRPMQSVPSTPDEIHVHIGRIEVRAVADAQDGNRRRARTNKQKTLSLEDYLAKRGGGC